MRTTLDIDDDLMAKARHAVGVASKSRVVELALELLIQAAARQRLAALHGAVRGAKTTSRRRPQRRPA
jgi:Arc/MetJ family transcription regulator